MIDILEPLPELETRARLRVYLEYLEHHRELQHVVLGCHNEMIMLERDPVSEAAVAILFATGAPGQRIAFPRHRHTKGESTACLAGTYGEYVGAADPVGDLALPEALGLDVFQARHPGTLDLRPEDGRVAVLLSPGAVWGMGAETEHEPFGIVDPTGLLLAQIRWPGPNVILG